jgi:hypothetical protein
MFILVLIALAEPRPRRNWRPYAIIGGLVYIGRQVSSRVKAFRTRAPMVPLHK